MHKPEAMYFFYSGVVFFHEYFYDGKQFFHKLSAFDGRFTKLYDCSQREYEDRFDKVKRGILR